MEGRNEYPLTGVNNAPLGGLARDEVRRSWTLDLLAADVLPVIPGDIVSPNVQPELVQLRSDLRDYVGLILEFANYPLWLMPHADRARLFNDWTDPAHRGMARTP